MTIDTRSDLKRGSQAERSDILGSAAVWVTRSTFAYLSGAVCVARAVAAGLVMPRFDTRAMTAHLAEIARMVAPGAHADLVLSGAGWHISRTLVVPENITLLTLPPYSSELNLADHLAVFASEQARQPDLCFLRGYCRGLLRGMEQLLRGPQSDPIHHVMRMGVRVIVYGGWYNMYSRAVVLQMGSHPRRLDPPMAG
ncbi:hypothetical protein [Methylobacterium nodulans]|uniref:hypothetical protein n=1 Tax=Methylobacterium nodulans TaxID=114616 RepID=UPI0012EEAAE7